MTTQGLIDIEGVETSAVIRQRLSDAGKPVLLAFSCGKDALASWLALIDAGVQVVPYYMYYIPGLAFVEESLDRYEQQFGSRIARYPHPSLYRWLNRFTFQAPEMLSIIDAAQLPQPSYSEIITLIREDHDLPADTWVADGVRAADSIVRRVSIRSHGAMKTSNRKVSVVWDWRKPHVLDKLNAESVSLPPDYEWFGRSFDGMDYRFLEPLSRHAPEDYQRILEWFPLAELELVRRGI